MCFYWSELFKRLDEWLRPFGLRRDCDSDAAGLACSAQTIDSPFGALRKGEDGLELRSWSVGIREHTRLYTYTECGIGS